MMDFTKYENKMAYPSTIKRVCKGCGSGFGPVDKFCSKCGHNVGTDYEADIIEKNALKESYNKEENRLYELFKNDALTEVGLINHPRANDIFGFVWKNGHSNGYYEVFNYLDDMAYLFTN